MRTFKNSVAFITGVGSGIGKQLALNLAAEGARIGGVDLNAGSLSALENDLKGAPCAFAVGDVTERSSLHRAVGEVQEKLGPVDLLIANAGIGRETSALAYRADEIEAIIRVNLIGVVNSVDAVLPGMLERQRGHLTAISSLASFRGLPRMAGYCASKAGVNALMDSLRVELKPHGIQCTTVCPGWIRTAMTSDLGSLPGLLEVNDAANRILRAIRLAIPFHAFPRTSARRVRLLRLMPSKVSDWLVVKILGGLGQKR